MDKKYLVVDYDPEIIDMIAKRNVHFMYGDATDTELLEEINLSETKLVVSTVGDHSINVFLAKWLNKYNQQAVFVCAAETPSQATELYEEGVAYVMMPHYIGSEKINSFIKRNGFNKSEFRHYRAKHLLYLQTHYE
jgi:Trk K+ transport system NAD-binding subunit